MLTSLALIFLIGSALASLAQLLKLPRIIGLLATGILLGPHVLDLLDPSILSVSSDLRQMALVIILLKAGLSLNIADLKKVGRPAVMMAFVPATFEILAYVLFAPSILHISLTDAAVMGAVMGAVSPAVVVPRMVALMEERRGTAKGIPQMILAGASCDDIYVIVLFTTFVAMAQGGSFHAGDLLQVPVSICFGALLGIFAGILLSRLFDLAFHHGHMIRNSNKIFLILGTSFLLLAAETWLKGILSLSGLLAVVAMACTLQRSAPSTVTARLSEKLGKLWIAAEILLFVLVGAAVDIRYTMNAGAPAVLMIFLALSIRSLGVLLCLWRTPLNKKERLFCVIAYLPKATVQAAIGSLPLSMGLACGEIVLSVAVLSILISAPLGAIGIDTTAARLLEKEKEAPQPID